MSLSFDVRFILGPSHPPARTVISPHKDSVVTTEALTHLALHLQASPPAAFLEAHDLPTNFMHSSGPMVVTIRVRGLGLLTKISFEVLSHSYPTE